MTWFDRFAYIIHDIDEREIGDLGYPSTICNLQWHHNGRNCVSYQRRLSTQSFVEVQIKENILRHWALCGFSPVTGEFPAQRPVTRKMFPFHDVIMWEVWIKPTVVNPYKKNHIAYAKFMICIITMIFCQYHEKYCGLFYKNNYRFMSAFLSISEYCFMSMWTPTGPFSS